MHPWREAEAALKLTAGRRPICSVAPLRENLTPPLQCFQNGPERPFPWWTTAWNLVLAMSAFTRDSGEARLGFGGPWLRMQFHACCPKAGSSARDRSSAWV